MILVIEDFLGHIVRMNRWLSLVFLSLGNAWFLKEEIQEILECELRQELREFLALNFLSEATLSKVWPWLIRATRSLVSPLAEKAYETGKSFTGERKRVRTLLECMNECRRGKPCSKRSTLWRLAETVEPNTLFTREVIVEGFLGMKKIAEALSESLRNDKKSPLPVYESLDHPEAGEPPVYDAVMSPPSYETLFTEQFIESQSKLIHELILFGREANLEDVGALTDALVSLMFSNWVIMYWETFPNDFKRGSAAELSRLARQLEQRLALPAAAH